MNISRITATRIMSKAIQQMDHCLMGLIDASESLFFCQSIAEMDQIMGQDLGGIIFYNQHADAIRFIEAQSFQDGQIIIEIFQDTEGVFGLRAYQMNNRMQQPVDLIFKESPA